MTKIVGLGIGGVVITMIGLTLRLKVTNIGLYLLFVGVASIGFLLCFYAGKLYGAREVRVMGVTPSPWLISRFKIVHRGVM